MAIISSPCVEIFEIMEEFVRMVNQFNSSVLRAFLRILRDEKRTSAGEMPDFYHEVHSEGKERDGNSGSARDRKGQGKVGVSDLIEDIFS